MRAMLAAAVALTLAAASAAAQQPRRAPLADVDDFEPAVDVSRIVTMLGVVAVAYLLTRPSVARSRAKAARRRRPKPH